MIQVTLAGANFRPTEARNAVKALTIGSIVALEAEPDNEYDSNAVKVIAEGHHIGYVPRSDSAAVAARLEDDPDLTAEVIGFESTIKPVLEIDL